MFKERFFSIYHVDFWKYLQYLEILFSKYNDEITEGIIFNKLERAKVRLQYNEKRRYTQLLNQENGYFVLHPQKLTFIVSIELINLNTSEYNFRA